MNYKTLITTLLVVFLSTFATQAQKTTLVQGKILDEQTKKPIVGASVFVPQFTIGTNTDKEGLFKIELLPQVKSYTVSHIGYASLQVEATNLTPTIYLRLANNELSQVIVTGYGNIVKKRNTTSFSQVKMEDIRQVAVSGVDQLLEGQVAGLQLSNFNGGPNAAPKIRIRGTVSLSGTQDPLWVLDGLIIEGTELPNVLDKDNLNNLNNLPIAGINTDDIEDITVLKDAAATAIYGARAANGVIVITTKKGKISPPKISIQAHAFFSERPNFAKLALLNAAEKVDWELALAQRNDLTYFTDKGEVMRILTANNALDTYRKGGLSALNTNTLSAIHQLKNTQTHWGNELYRSTLNQQYTASLSGGNANATYYASAGYYHEQGATIGVGLKRYTASLKTNVAISNQLKFGASLFGTGANRSSFIQDQDAFTNPSNYARTANPYLTIRDAEGKYRYDADIRGIADRFVPFNIIEERSNTNYSLHNKGIKGIADLTYQMTPWLSFRTELGLQFDENKTERYAAQETYYTRKFKERTRYSGNKYFLPEGGIINNQNSAIFEYQWKSFAEFNQSFARHHFNFLGGAELRKTTAESISATGFGFDANTLVATNISPSPSEVNNSLFRQYGKNYVQNAYTSFYMRGSYTYHNRYTIFGSIRSDASNLFGVDSRYRYLPIWSLAASWNVSEELWLEKTPWISNLKLRTSYGVQGNLNRSIYPFITGNYTTADIFGTGTAEKAINITTPPNDKLRWEKTQSFDAGIDIGLFNNALQVTLDYYHRKSTDIVAPSPLPLETGFETITRNWGAISNRGWELTITTRNLSRKNFSWHTDFNVAHNRSKILRIQPSAASYQIDAAVGYPVNSLFVINTHGLDTQGIPQFANSEGLIQSLEQYFKISGEDPFAGIPDLEGLYASASTQITAEQYRNLYRYIGSKDPEFSGGFTNRMRYRGFDLAIATLFNLGQWTLQQPTYNPALLDRGLNQTQSVLQAFDPLTNMGTLPAFGSDQSSHSRWLAYSWYSVLDPVNSYRNYDIWAKKINYMRINSIRLGYTLPKYWSQKIQASQLRLSLEGRNLFVLSNGHKGYFDPETYGNIYAQPLAKSIAIGLSASF